MSEMAFARKLLKGDKKEVALLRKFPNEAFFGFQFATNAIDEGVKVAAMAAERGAAFIDLNCGCPIHEATRRGLGSALLRKPHKLARLVAGIAQGSPIPFTVKIRLGLTGTRLIADRLVPELQAAGAAAVTIHGRTAEQRYKRPADWDYIDRVAADVAVPVIGNGDVLTHFEARHRLGETACHAIMVGRGALIKPWIFQEIEQGVDMQPTSAERVGVYRTFVGHMKDYFYDDALGRKRAFRFLPWHLGFLCRYRPMPEAIYGEHIRAGKPLLSMRQDVFVPEIGESLADLTGLERLLRCAAPAAHEHIANVLWESQSDKEAVAKLEELCTAHLADWEAEARASDAAASNAEAPHEG